jgi:hypothetical protein
MFLNLIPVRCKALVPLHIVWVPVLKSSECHMIVPIEGEIKMKDTNNIIHQQLISIFLFYNNKNKMTKNLLVILVEVH